MCVFGKNRDIWRDAQDSGKLPRLLLADEPRFDVPSEARNRREASCPAAIEPFPREDEDCDGNAQEEELPDHESLTEGVSSDCNQ